MRHILVNLASEPCVSNVLESSFCGFLCVLCVFVLVNSQTRLKLTAPDAVAGVRTANWLANKKTLPTKRCVGMKGSG